ncbi:phospholipase A2-like [Oratosquilla oratoria]|uniref:phospholipase A2-like n=1 Tax=Oratosquilla oratoria TaxID=337810 RepID=UPI003F76A03F
MRSFVTLLALTSAATLLGVALSSPASPVDILLLSEEQKGFTVPGTKWCGDGDSAADYDDLGTSVELDKCCREHDLCPDFMYAGETKHNLTNNGLFTRSHCSCDEKLASCFHQVNSLMSNSIGNVFFTVWHMKCYKEDYPIVKCLHKALNGQCQEYELDTTKPKLYQWFDAKVYHTSSMQDQNVV